MNVNSWLISAMAVAAATSATAADYAPIDCSKAATTTERTICKSYALGQADARMSTLYGLTTSLVGMGRRGAIMDEQRDWLKARDACGKSASCLRKSYDARIDQLGAVMADVISKGPF